MSNDIYTKFENGLEILLEKLAEHKEYGHARILEYRLRENIEEARRFGETPDRKANRAEIIEQLNRLAGLALGVSFNDIYQSSPLNSLASVQQPPLLQSNPPLESDINQYHLPVDLEPLRTAVQQCSALLRQQKNTFADTEFHIEREEVDQIVKWLLEDGESEKNVAMLLDQAGMGKTVVMHDILHKLEANDTVVLAIKADRHFSGANKWSEIQEKLNLPEPPLHMVSQLAKAGRVIILIDQIDALSLSLAHDWQTLDVVLDLVARLRYIPNVKLLLSCRIFDREADPRLKNIELGNSFSLRRLTDEQVNGVLAHLGVDQDVLSRATKELLCIPLHLDLFAYAVVNQSKMEQLRGVASLQELYALIWQNIVLKNEMDRRLISERIEVIDRLTGYMNEHQRPTAPQSLFQKSETTHLMNAANWLASSGILLSEGVTWSFLHQTFFDYCYARQFIENDNDIVSIILASKQSIFERPKLQHIIEYLRGNDHPRYLRDLQRLLNTPNLRFHLYDLLLQWFGSLPNPTDDEWLFAQRMLNNEGKRWPLLRVMQANVGWFGHLQPVLKNWLVHGNDTQVEQALSYLASIIEIAQAQAVSMLKPFLGKNDEWDQRITNVISRIRNWHTEDAINLHEQIIYKQTSLDQHLFWQIKDITTASPKAGCRILRHIFDMALKLHLEKLVQMAEEHNEPIYSPSVTLFSEMRNLEWAVQDALKTAGHLEPRHFVDEMMPWVIKVVTLSYKPELEDQWFLSDAISYNWYDNTFRVQSAFVHSLIDALKQVAQYDSSYFRQLATELAKMPYETPQQLLTHVYRALPEQYATDAFEFLLGDQRRLDIGDSEQYDSRQVISAIYPYLKDEQRQQLEMYILNYGSIYKYLGLRGLRRRGIEQYRLLHAIPKQFRSSPGNDRLREWKRKFVDYEITEAPSSGVVFEAVGSPIDGQGVIKMSDNDWLQAMQKYKGSTEHRDFLRGGAHELAPLLSERVKNDPVRFFRLFERIPDDVDDAYATAFVNGFAESDRPEEWFFRAILRFGSQEGRNNKREIAWAIKKYVKVNVVVPDSILKLLSNWVYGPMNDDEWRWAQEGNREGAYHRYLNSDRGAALGAIMRILDARDPEDAVDKKWQLVEYVASDPSTALRVGAIRELTYMIKHDRERSWALFEQLVAGHEVLFESQHVREFLYWSLYKNFLAVQPCMVQMMAHPNEEVQERGAGLACIAAISDKVMESEEARIAAKTLAESAIAGLSAWRRGAARIYTYNMTRGSEIETQRLCQEMVCQLIDDPDKGVRETIDQKFYSMQGEHFFALRQFMEEYALADLHLLEHGFAKYLWEHGMQDPSWSLGIVQTLLNKDTQPNQWHSGMEELMRLVLRIYMSSLIDEATREEALDTFDSLMEQYGGIATKVLSEWDSR